MQYPFAYTSLQAQRRKLGLTQEQVARRSGLRQANYSRIEQGKTDPRLTTLQEIARALSLEIMLVPGEFADTVNAFIGRGSAPQNKPLFVADPD